MVVVNGVTWKGRLSHVRTWNVCWTTYMVQSESVHSRHANAKANAPQAACRRNARIPQTRFSSLTQPPSKRCNIFSIEQYYMAQHSQAIKSYKIRIARLFSDDPCDHDQ